MTGVCKKHVENPVVGYSPCPGCEVEWLRAKVENYKKLYEQASWHLKEMVMGDDAGKAWDEAQEFLNETWKEGY